jgi:50S ribosomal protein L16 3-hydroxylase
LADASMLDGAIYAALSEAGRDAAFALYEAGHYQRPADEEE